MWEATGDGDHEQGRRLCTVHGTARSVLVLVSADRTHAARQVFPARMLHTVGKHVPFDTACVIEPLTVAVRAGE